MLKDTLNLANHGISLYETVRDDDNQIVDFRVVAMNHLAEQLHGVSAEQSEGRLVTAIFPAIRSHPNWARTIRVAETGLPFHETVFTTFPLARTDGWFDLSIRPWHTGVAITYQPLRADLGKETTCQQRPQLEQQARLFDSVLDQMLNGLLILKVIRDEKGQLDDVEYVRASRSLEQHGVASVEQLIGKRMRSLYPHATQTEIWRRYQALLETGTPQRFEEYYQADGLDIWMDISLTLLDNDTILSIYQPISELKRYQQALETQNQLLCRTNENLQQFAYVASHDLQEPLRKIRSFGDILESRYSPVLDNDGSDLIRRMQSSAARMTYLVQDLLTYSRLTTHRQPHAPVDLGYVMQRVRLELLPEIEKASIRLVIPELPPVPGDSPQLFQLFFGLVNNAIKFRKSESPCEITISHCLVKGAEIPAEEVTPISHTYHCIKVQDNGIGFDPVYTNRIFTIFQRLHSKSKYPGTGIGLAICKKVVDNHNGYLTATSQPGAGSTFAVYLPK